MNEFTQLFFKELRNEFHKKMESSEFNRSLEMTEYNIDELYNMNQKLNRMIEIIKGLNNTSLKVLQKDLKVPIANNIATPIITNNKNMMIKHQDQGQQQQEEIIHNEESELTKKTKYPFEIEEHTKYFDNDSNSFLEVDTKDDTIDLDPLVTVDNDNNDSTISKYFIQDHNNDKSAAITVTPHTKNWKEGYEKQYKNTKNARIA